MAATRKLDQSELMIRAGAQGESAVQRSQESRTRNRQQTLSRKESARQFNKSIEQQELDRSQRQWEVQRADRAKRDAVRAENQAGKKDMTIFGQQGRQQRENEERYKAETVSEREKFEEGKRQFGEKQSLEAAKAGLKSGGKTGMAAPKDPVPSGKPMAEPQNIVQVPTAEPQASPGGVAKASYITEGSDVDRTGAQALMSPRMQGLDQEMGMREQEQMGQPIELGTQGSGWVADPSTPAGQAATIKRQSAQLALYKSRRDLGFKMQEAQARLDAASTKENKALLKESEVKAQARLANFSDRFERFDNAMGMTGDKPTADDWTKIKQLVLDKNLPDVGNAEGIHAAIRESKVNARLIEWMGERRSNMAVLYVANGTGELPDREYVDFLTDGMKEFMNEVQAARLKTKFDFGGPVGLMSATTRARQRRVVQKMAAMTILGRKTMQVGPEGTAGNTEQVMQGQEGGQGASAVMGAQGAQEVGATGGQVHGAAPGASPMSGGPRQRALGGNSPDQMGRQQANLGEPRKWSEVK